MYSMHMHNSLAYAHVTTSFDLLRFTLTDIASILRLILNDNYFKFDEGKEKSSDGEPSRLTICNSVCWSVGKEDIRQLR